MFTARTFFNPRALQTEMCAESKEIVFLSKMTQDARVQFLKILILYRNEHNTVVLSSNFSCFLPAFTACAFVKRTNGYRRCRSAPGLWMECFTPTHYRNSIPVPETNACIVRLLLQIYLSLAKIKMQAHLNDVFDGLVFFCFGNV